MALRFRCGSDVRGERSRHRLAPKIRTEAIRAHFAPARRAEVFRRRHSVEDDPDQPDLQVRLAGADAPVEANRSGLPPGPRRNVSELRRRESASTTRGGAAIRQYPSSPTALGHASFCRTPPSDTAVSLTHVSCDIHASTDVEGGRVSNWVLNPFRQYRHSGR